MTMIIAFCAIVIVKRAAQYERKRAMRKGWVESAICQCLTAIAARGAIIEVLGWRKLLRCNFSARR
ncbi:hypothetical protein GCM10011395_19270 [Sphingomonas psychrolutea]|uniref:Uncharacterized protein n=1 Tax=Sphingomonas psychrolutea TaxID=1259676 RepID=A0ABQ1GRV2_9SPHN|nr:hypothetical protein GCM10011395_19270 [Sphingomonas psychrolutea]